VTVPTRRVDVALAGAGIMGLSLALEEARRGKTVAVLSPAEQPGAASRAAAGILVTRDAQVFHSAFREFYVRSIHAYPAWLDRLEALGGGLVPLHRHGDTVVFDLDRPEARDQLEAKRRQWDREHARNYTESEALPGFLAPHSRLGKVKVFRFPEEAHIQNRDLVDALRKACKAQGVAFLDAVGPGPWDVTGGLTRLRAGTEIVEARQVVITAGAWSAALLESLGYKAPIIPVRGQLMRIPKFHPDPGMVHYGEDLYLVPRGDTLIVGATTEPGSWNENFDDAGADYLETHLRRFLPEVAAGPVETWAGLRPRTVDRLPWMGWLDPGRGWALCAGHYKCGISMAPLAAESMSALLNGEKPPIELGPFDPWRKKGLTKR
jgi:glycine oxidase